MSKTSKNTTIQNVKKQEKLSQEHIIPKHIVNHTDTKNFLLELGSMTTSKEVLLYSLGKKLVGDNDNKFYQKFLAEYAYKEVSLTMSIPQEFDLLGAAYQFLNTKYENLSLGSFYTNKELALAMTAGLKFDKNQTLLDPSCGSGVFLFSADIPEDRIVGVDFDPIAVMIAKFNFFIKFPNAKNYPQIYVSDFIDWYVANKNNRYTYIVGNPPYGADLDIRKLPSKNITSGESFSYFIEYSFALLEKDGLLSYLLPESILHVKRHTDIRDFILDNTNLVKIRKYDTKFAGVMSDIYQIDLDKNKTKNMTFIMNNKTMHVSKDSFRTLKNHIFVPLDKKDITVIEKVRKKSYHTLKNSIFALGVVTGDNASKLLDGSTPFTEPIFTGKEIEKYGFTTCKKHIVFDRKNLQQVAPDEVYRSPAKIVYKVISTKIKVAIDFGQNLTSSSANIIIPNVPGNNVYSVAILLNSDLYTFLNQKLHGAVNKMSKDNFEALPFPEFTDKELETIQSIVEDFINNKISETKLQEYVYNYFSITAVEREYISSQIL